MSSDRKPKSGLKPRPSAASSKATRSKPTATSRSSSEAKPKGGSEARPKGGSEAKPKGGSKATSKSRSRATSRSSSEAKPKSRSRAEARRRSKPDAGRKREPNAKRGRRRRAPPREISAGGVVVRGEEVVVIVPTRRASDGSRVLGLPKGHVDPGETPIQAAEREVREETGIIAEVVRELGEARYWYRRNGQTIGKSVSFYLFSHRGGDTADHDDEVEEVRWIGLKEAQTALTHEAEREMVELALASLEEGASKDR